MSSSTLATLAVRSSISVRLLSASPSASSCFDRKQSEEVYTSHFVKDQAGPNGKVVCPLLLAQQCANCGQHGHVTSRCSQNRSSNHRRGRRSKPSGNKLGAWIKPSDKKQRPRKRRPRARIHLIPSTVIVANSFAPLTEKTTQTFTTRKEKPRFDMAQPALQGAWLDEECSTEGRVDPRRARHPRCCAHLR